MLASTTRLTLRVGFNDLATLAALALRRFGDREPGRQLIRAAAVREPGEGLGPAIRDRLDRAAVPRG